MIGNKKTIAQLWGREFNVVKQGLSQSQVYDCIAELVNQNNALTEKTQHVAFLERLAEQTVAEADKLALGIRNKAQEEATNILQMAEEEAAEVKAKATEEVKRLLTGSRERLESKLKQKADEVYQRILGRVEETIGEVWSLELVSEVIEAPAQQPTSVSGSGEGSVPELVEEMEEPAAEEPGPISYDGRVDLGIVPPVDLAQFMKLRKGLQHIPQLKVLQITSSQKRGSTISTSLTEPIPLLDMLKVMPEVHEAVAETCVGATAGTESQPTETIERIVIKLASAEQT